MINNCVFLLDNRYPGRIGDQVPSPHVSASFQQFSLISRLRCALGMWCMLSMMMWCDHGWPACCTHVMRACCVLRCCVRAARCIARAALLIDVHAQQFTKMN